jgi:hypothetical protein
MRERSVPCRRGWGARIDRFFARPAGPKNNLDTVKGPGAGLTKNNLDEVKDQCGLVVSARGSGASGHRGRRVPNNPILGGQAGTWL